MAFGFRRFPGRHGRPALAALLAIVVAAPSAAHVGAAIPDARSQRSTTFSGLVDPSRTTDVSATARVDPPAAATPDPGNDAAAGLQPSIQFEEAEAHARDKIDFTPGATVTVGFTPRSSDRWKVGGVDPTALPAGRLDGRTMRGQGKPDSGDNAAGPFPGRTHRTGAVSSTDASVAPAADPATVPDPSVDLPAESGAPVAATGTSWQPDASTTTVTTDAVISLAGLRREIFGFLPYWQVNSGSLRLDYTKISTIAFFGVGVDGAGNLIKRNADGTVTVGWSGWTSSKVTSLISTAHANHTRVVLTIQSFGWNTSGLARQKALLGSSTARLNLARQISAAIRDRGADGVNLDVEPLASGYDAEFTALVRTIRAELNKIHAGYQITFDTTGSIGNYPIENATAAGGADAIFIMGYDYRVSDSSPVGSIDPLVRDGYDIRDTVAAYSARVAPSKLILGVPYYGRAWSTSSSGLNATNTSGTKFGASTTVIYDTAADYLARYGRRYDPLEQVAWTAYPRQNCTPTYGCVNSWRQIYVDDATALGKKYDLVNTYGLRGAGIWALGYDGTRPDLWNAIKLKFVTDTTPPTVGVKSMAARQVNPEFTVSWTGVDDVAISSYDVQRSIDGGAWADWLLKTTWGSAVWDGDDGHSYAFRVRARDPKGNVSAWNVVTTTTAAAALGVGGFGVVRLDGLSIRSAADPLATKLGVVNTGDVLAIVGGPTMNGGYTWYQVVGPLSTWGAVKPAWAGAWVATSSASQVRVSPTKAPNTTAVAAMLGHLGFGGAGVASLGTSSAAVARRAFSPNGDGRTDGLAIAWTNGVALDTLVLRVFRANGTLVGTVPVAELAAGDRHVSWDGRVGGSRLPDGRYLVSLVGTAGAATYYNPVASFRPNAVATYGATIDTVAPTVTSASIGGSLLSPNGDGIHDTVRLAIASTGASTWSFTAAPLTGATVGAPVRIRTGPGGSVALTWDGRTSAGALAHDGMYRLTLTVADSAGNPASRAWNVRLDTTRPTVALTAPASFSPNGDFAADTARLGWTSTERIAGIARIYRGMTLVRSWTISGLTSGAIFWTGTDAAGRKVGDGIYTFRVSGRDAAGNLGSRSLSFKLDRTLTTLRWAPTSFFPQDGDALRATTGFSFSQSRSAVVSASIWSGTTLVRTIWTNRTLAAGAHSWTWNGRDAAGALVPRGTYAVRVTATSWIGQSGLSRSVLADAFATSLSATSVTAGQTLTMTFSTVEPLRAGGPYVTFSQPGKTSIRKTATALGSGRYRVSFAAATGSAGTATIGIAAHDTAGGVNSSTRNVTIR